MTQAAVDSALVVARPCAVALVIPTLNEEASIGDVVRAVPRGVIDRIIVADGGSTDATPARAREASAEVVEAGARAGPSPPPGPIAVRGTAVPGLSRRRRGGRRALHAAPVARFPGWAVSL